MDFRNENYIEKFSNIENTINSSNLTEYQKITLLKQIEELISHELLVFRNAFEKSYFKTWDSDTRFKRWSNKQNTAFENALEKNK